MFAEIEKIIASGDLRNFILGQKKYARHTPDEDAQAWRELENLYEDSVTSSKVKQLIKKSVLNLFQEQGDLSKRSALILSRSLDIVEIQEALIQFVKNNKISKMKTPLQNSVCVTIAHFKIQELKSDLISFIVSENRIKSFLLSSQTRLEEDCASEDDLWRMGLLAEYYSISDSSIRNKIEDQVKNFFGVEKKLDTIIKEFMELNLNNALSILLKKYVT